MLIRSQDRTILANLEQYKYAKIRAYEKKLDNKGEIIYAYDEGCGTPGFNCWKIETSDFDLGEYFTEEKAIKVLDMIQNAYEMSPYCDRAFDQSANVMRPYIFVNNMVFQIPQDAEVEE